MSSGSRPPGVNGPEVGSARSPRHGRPRPATSSSATRTILLNELRTRGRAGATGERAGLPRRGRSYLAEWLQAFGAEIEHIVGADPLATRDAHGTARASILWIDGRCCCVHGGSSRCRWRARASVRLHTARASQPRVRTTAHLRGDRRALKRTGCRPCHALHGCSTILSRTRSTGRPGTSPRRAGRDRVRRTQAEPVPEFAMNLEGKGRRRHRKRSRIGRAYALALAEAGCAGGRQRRRRRRRGGRPRRDHRGGGRVVAEVCAVGQRPKRRTSSSPVRSRPSGASTSCAPTQASFATASSGT